MNEVHFLNGFRRHAAEQRRGGDTYYTGGNQMSNYKRTMDKIRLREEAKNDAKRLYHQVNVTKRIQFRTIVKPVVAVAMCIALIITAGTWGYKPGKNPETPAISNSFSVTVMAEELTEGKSIPIIADGEDCGIIASENEDGNIEYSITAPISCKGENIDTITYSINHGFFQITAPENDDPVISGTKYQGELFAPEAYVGEKMYILNAYENFTVKYENQPGKDHFVEICGITSNPDCKKIFKEQLNLEQEGKEALVKDLVLTCKVNYKDGTSQSKDIIFHTTIMTAKEAESRKREPSQKPVPEKYANQKNVYITLGLKQ